MKQEAKSGSRLAEMKQRKNPWDDPIYRKRMSDVHKGYKWSKEVIEARRKSLLKSGNKPSFKKKMSKISKCHWKNPIYIKRMAEAMKKVFTKQYRKQQSQTKIRLWKDPVYRKKMLRAIRKSNQNPKRNNRIGKTGKLLWADPFYKDRVIHSQRKGLSDSMKKANKPESLILKMLMSLKVKARFVGNRKLIIGGKNPDIEIVGKKKLIEVFGDYWHRNDSPKKRIEHFRKLGYDCLVFWEGEIKTRPERVRNKLMQWL